MHREVLKHLLNSYSTFYIVVETKHTKHHIERLMPTCKDRGRFKWIAETNSSSFEEMTTCQEARRSHIDRGDLFPRLFFLADSMLNELFAWLEARDLTITDITSPKI